MTPWKTMLPGTAALLFCAGIALAQTDAPASDAPADAPTSDAPAAGAPQNEAPQAAAPPTGSGAPAPPEVQTLSPDASMNALPEAPANRRMPGRPDAYLYIGWPNNGETVNGRFKVWFGLRNFGVAPAGVRNEGTGHHHLLIDVDLPPMDEPIPNDRNHLHFGKGQTETYLELPPGRHTLQLLLADDEHVPHDPPIVSRKITINVRPMRGS